MSDTIVWPDLKSKIPRIDQALKQALAEAEKEGHRQGFEKGEKEGREAADVELAELRAHYGEAVKKLDATRLAVEAGQVRALATMVRTLCEKVIGAELTTSSTLLDQVLAHAVEKLSTAPHQIEICLNPARQWCHSTLTSSLQRMRAK